MNPLIGALGAGILVLITWADGKMKSKETEQKIKVDNENLRRKEQERYESEIQIREKQKSELHETNRKLNEDVRQTNEAKTDISEAAAQEIIRLLKEVEANHHKIARLELEVNAYKAEAKSKGMTLKLALPWKG